MQIFPNFSQKFDDYPVTPKDYFLDFLWDIASFVIKFGILISFTMTFLQVWSLNFVEELPEMCLNIK